MSENYATNPSHGGGAIYTNGAITLDGSFTVQNNHSVGSGGALYSQEDVQYGVILMGTGLYDFSKNIATGVGSTGGAIYGVKVHISTNSKLITFTANKASKGTDHISSASVQVDKIPGKNKVQFFDPPCSMRPSGGNYCG